jgi:leucyl-tRNA synthetase
VNGKVRGRITLARGTNEADAKAAALADASVKAAVGDKTIKKFIYVPGKIVNIVV